MHDAEAAVAEQAEVVRQLKEGEGRGNQVRAACSVHHRSFMRAIA